MDALQYLNRRTNEQIDAINRNYKQYLTWNNILEQRKLADLMKIEKNSAEMQKNIKRKLVDYQTGKEVDYKKNKGKLDSHHRRRSKELIMTMQKNQEKIVEKYKYQSYQNEVCCKQKFENVRKQIMTESNKRGEKERNDHGRQDDNAQSSNEESMQDTAAAVNRYKRRQMVLMKNYIALNVQIQILSEGLVILWKSNEENNKKFRSECLPWGFQAHELLHTVMCGEFPHIGNINIEEYYGDLLQGGLIKCTISDVRGSEDEFVHHYKRLTDMIQKEKIGKILTSLQQRLDVEISRVKMCENLVEKVSHELQRSDRKLKALQSQAMSIYSKGKHRVLGISL
jgi:hypothetical protein